MNKALVYKIAIVRRLLLCNWLTKRDSLNIVPETLIATNVRTIASLLAACVFGCILCLVWAYCSYFLLSNYLMCALPVS